MTLIFQPPAKYCRTHAQAKIKVKGHFFRRIERKQADWRTDMTDFINFLAKAVANIGHTGVCNVDRD